MPPPLLEPWARDWHSCVGTRTTVLMMAAVAATFPGCLVICNTDSTLRSWILNNERVRSRSMFCRGLRRWAPQVAAQVVQFVGYTALPLPFAV